MIYSPQSYRWLASYAAYDVLAGTSLIAILVHKLSESRFDGLLLVVCFIGLIFGTVVGTVLGHRATGRVRAGNLVPGPTLATYHLFRPFRAFSHTLPPLLWIWIPPAAAAAGLGLIYGLFIGDHNIFVIAIAACMALGAMFVTFGCMLVWWWFRLPNH